MKENIKEYIKNNANAFAVAMWDITKEKKKSTRFYDVYLALLDYVVMYLKAFWLVFRLCKWKFEQLRINPVLLVQKGLY